MEAQKIEILMNWVQKKDYSQINNWTVFQLLEQLEERLKFLDHALRNQGNISKHISWMTLDKDIIEIQGDYSPIVKSNRCELLPKSGLAALASLPAIRGHDDEPSIAIKKAEYAFQNLDGELFVALAVALSKSTDKEILQDLAYALVKIREDLGIPEPSELEGRTQNLGAIKSIVNYRAIEYLDIVLWLIKEYQLSYIPEFNKGIISTIELTKLLNINKPPSKVELGSEELTKWNSRFLSTKLIDPEWIKATMENIRKDKNLMETSVNRALN